MCRTAGGGRRRDRRAAPAGDRYGVPASALLTVAGVLYGLTQPDHRDGSELILTFVLPPLLYSRRAACIPDRDPAHPCGSSSACRCCSSWPPLWSGSGCPGLVPASAWLPASRSAGRWPRRTRSRHSVGRRAGLPGRLINIEGEGLLNDATALTILSVAITAAVSGTFSFSQATSWWSWPSVASR